MQNSIQDIIGNVYCLGRFCSQQTCVCVHTWNENDERFYGCRKCKACCHVLNLPVKNENRKYCYGGDGTFCFVKKTSRDYETEKQSPFL